MAAIHLALDDGLLEAIGRAAAGKPVTQVARELLVLELYRQEVISSGKAAELLDMPLLEFIRFSGRRGIPFVRLDDQELDAELQASREL